MTRTLPCAGYMRPCTRYIYITIFVCENQWRNWYFYRKTFITTTLASAISLALASASLLWLAERNMVCTVRVHGAYKVCTGHEHGCVQGIAQTMAMYRVHGRVHGRLPCKCLRPVYTAVFGLCMAVYTAVYGP